MTKNVALALAYLGSVVAGIIIVSQTPTPTISVLPGVIAPAAVYTVGLTLVFRDLLQRRIGAGPTLGLMVAAIAISFFFSPAFATASAIAFGASELVDLGVFSYVKRYGLLLAVVASGAVAIVVDSFIFLTLAFGNLDFLWGQIAGKALITLVSVGVIAVIDERRQGVTA